MKILSATILAVSLIAGSAALASQASAQETTDAEASESFSLPAGTNEQIEAGFRAAAESEGWLEYRIQIALDHCRAISSSDRAPCLVRQLETRRKLNAIVAGEPSSAPIYRPAADWTAPSCGLAPADPACVHDGRTSETPAVQCYSHAVGDPNRRPLIGVLSGGCIHP